MTASLSTKLIHLCRAHRKVAESRLNAIGLYAGQEAILLTLLAGDGLSLGELAGAMGVEPPTMTKAVSRLERAGFVERRADPDDARVARVFITAAGRALEGDIRAIWDDIEAQLTAGLSDAETLLLERLLPGMIANMSDR